MKNNSIISNSELKMSTSNMSSIATVGKIVFVVVLVYLIYIQDFKCLYADIYIVINWVNNETI
jgi:hypothetical protein